MTAHSNLGASSAHRWMACPGSVRLCENVKGAETSYTIEGTVAHMLAESCLTNGKDAAEYVDLELQYKKQPYTITEEMAEAVQVYIDAIKAERQPGDEFNIETKFDLETITGRPGLFGTNDCSIYREKDGLLIVYDYKHGAGKPVEIERNPQLLYYALGAATRKSNRKLSTVRLTVIQPRYPHPKGPVRSWDIDAMELLDWSADLIEAAAATDKPDAPIVPGDHCLFCPAAAGLVCPAVQNAAMEAAASDFSADKGADPKQVAAWLEKVPQIELWCSSVREYAYTQAEGGTQIPGWKLVDKQVRRKWIDPDVAAVMLFRQGLKTGDIHNEPKLKTVAQIEKLLPKGGYEQIKHLVDDKPSGHKLVPESHKGAAVRPSAEEDFAIFT